MIRPIYAGRDRLWVPDGWATFRWNGRRYRVRGDAVEFWSVAKHAWVTSLFLTTRAPRGTGGLHVQTDKGRG